MRATPKSECLVGEMSAIKPPNNPIKLAVRPVTHLALARRAPVRPVAYRVR